MSEVIEMDPTIPTNGTTHAEVIPIPQQHVAKPPAGQATHYLMPVIDVQQMVHRRDMMIEYTRQIMVEGIDYGTIPGTPKPTLYKPGAEKLVSAFGLTPKIISKEQELDWTGERHGGEPFFYFGYTFTMSRDERVLGTGEGSANSWESKHRYRWVNENEVPAHLNRAALQRRDSTIWAPKFAVEKAETTGEYGKPAEYWQRFQEAIANGTAVRDKKNTRNGKPMDIIGIPGAAFRVPNPDVADQVNTLQKMAQKRAYIQAVLMALGVSEFFTQDLEDLYSGPDATPEPEPTTTASAPKAPAASTPEPPPPPPPPSGDEYGPIPTKAAAPAPAPEPPPPAPPAAPSDADALKAAKGRIMDYFAARKADAAKANAAIGQYLRGYCGLAQRGPMPTQNPLYLAAMTKLADNIADLATDLWADANALGKRMAEPPTAEEAPTSETASEGNIIPFRAELKTHRELDDAALDAWIGACGVADAGYDEMIAWLTLAWHTRSVKLACSDRWPLTAVVLEIERVLGRPIGMDASLSSEVERLLIGLTTDPKSPLLKG